MKAEVATERNTSCWMNAFYRSKKRKGKDLEMEELHSFALIASYCKVHNY